MLRYLERCERMNKSNLFDPNQIEILEIEDRKIWQNPDEVLEKIDIKDDFVVADLGCGSGFFTLPLSRKARKVFGIDVQKRMLEFLKNKIIEMKVKNIEILLSKKNRIPLENESIDVLVSINALHEFEDLEKMGEEIKRVVKTGGKLLIVDFRKKNTDYGPPKSVRISHLPLVLLVEEFIV